MKILKHPMFLFYNSIKLKTDTNKMNKLFLISILSVIGGTCFVHETQTMSRFSRFKTFLKKKTSRIRNIKFHRSYTRPNGATKLEKFSTRIALPTGLVVGSYTLWDWFKQKVGFGEKTTLSEPMNFIPTPDQIERRHEKYDENPNLQLLSHLGFTKISQVTTAIQKQLKRKLSPQEKENVEKLIAYMAHAINPEKTLHGTTTVNSLELLPLLLYMHSKDGKGDEGRQDLLPKFVGYSPFIYNGLTESPLIQVLSEKNVIDDTNINEISKKICAIAKIKNVTKFSNDFLQLINSSENYKHLKKQADLLVVEDSFFYYRAGGKSGKSCITVRLSEKTKSRVFSFDCEQNIYKERELNRKWLHIYFGDHILDEDKNYLPAYKFFQDKKMRIEKYSPNFFNEPKPSTFKILQAPISENSIYTLYDKGLGADLLKLINKHNGKFESND